MTENARPEKVSSGATALVGRQPIYGREVDVFAYELLFRNSEVNQACFVDGDMATAQVMLNAFMEIGIDNIVDQHLAFINLTRGFIVAGHCFALPKDRVVLEVLETVEVDEDVITALSRLSKEGYRIALDDFVYHESLQPLVDLADIIKIDVMELDRETRWKLTTILNFVRSWDLTISKGIFSVNPRSSWSNESLPTGWPP